MKAIIPILAAVAIAIFVGAVILLAFGSLEVVVSKSLQF